MHFFGLPFQSHHLDKENKRTITNFCNTKLTKLRKLLRNKSQVKFESIKYPKLFEIIIYFM